MAIHGNTVSERPLKAMRSSIESPQVEDQSPEMQQELRDLLYGLEQSPKWISSMYFYDEYGSKLFDRITALPEYYLTRTELAIMQDRSDPIAYAIGKKALIIEPGSGNGQKIRILLEALHDPVAYVPVEIAREHLARSAESLAKMFPNIEILPVWADFTRPFEVPEPTRPSQRKIIYFPGSTIGNFEPQDARKLLRNMAGLVGTGGGALIGVDLVKDPKIIEAAYNDKSGVTARFNLNMLSHLNRRFAANFDLSNFEHKAFFNSCLSRIEMHLISQRNQTVRIAGRKISFRRGEPVYTESSYKYTDKQFRELARSGGFRLVQSWKDAREMFSVRYLVCDDVSSE